MAHAEGGDGTTPKRKSFTAPAGARSPIDAPERRNSASWNEKELREAEQARKREAEARHRAQVQVAGEAVEENSPRLADNPFKRRDSKAGNKENAPISNVSTRALTDEQKEIAALKTSGVARERANSLGVQLTPRGSKPFWQKCLPCFAPQPAKAKLISK